MACIKILLNQWVHVYDCQSLVIRLGEEKKLSTWEGACITKAFRQADKQTNYWMTRELDRYDGGGGAVAERQHVSKVAIPFTDDSQKPLQPLLLMIIL